MAVDLDGSRHRLFHERMQAEQQEGNPIKQGITAPARDRLIRDIEAAATRVDDKTMQVVSYSGAILKEVQRVFGRGPNTIGLAYTPKMPLEHFLSVLEIAANILYSATRIEKYIGELQSILKDDLSAFRFVRVSADPRHTWHIQLIDNEHLHREIVDRTFELTRVVAFESAQRDYAEAWKHYSRGDFDDALVNAHKALESACKIIIKRVDPTSTPDDLQTNQLIPLLVSLDIIPSRMLYSATKLAELLTNAGTLRNNAGTGHGSLDLASPEAAVTLLGLRLAGTYVSHLATRWEQLKPRTSS